jgi:hypothetical protein
MAERVFPNNINVDMGSKIQFSGINWGEVEHNLKNPRYAEDSSVIELLEKLTGASEEDIEKAVEELKQEAGNATQEEDEDSNSDKGHSDEKNDGNDGNDEDDADDMKSEASWRSSGNKNMRKIAFTHPSQISAEAIELAEAAGDIELKKTILAARKANRLRIASAIQENLKNEAFLLKRKAQREAIVRMAQSTDEQAKNTLMDALQSGAPLSPDIVNAYNAGARANTSGSDSMGSGSDSMGSGSDSMGSGSDSMGSADAFSSAMAFSKAQRKAFAKAALEQGMPIEYINSICPPVVSTKVKRVANSASEIVKSGISLETKKAAIASLIKEAKLSQDSKSEFIDYWNNVLGYQDKDFWPMVAEDYTDKKVSE